MSDPTVRGRFVWHELMTTDTKSAAAFFRKVLGWNTQAFDNEYSLFVTGKNQRAGLMILPDEARQMGARPHWLSYIGTPDVDATARQAASLGATVLKSPADIPTVGRFAVLQDPQGAVFAIFTPLSAAGPERDAAVGEYSWHELATTDWRSALEFYRALFGWVETNRMDMGPGGTYVMYGHDGRTLGGMMNKPKEQPGPPAWLPYVRVPDSRKTAAAFKKAGGAVIFGPDAVPGGDLIAQGLDPQGAVFAMHSVTAAVAKAPAAKRGKNPARKPAKKAAGTRVPAARRVARKKAAASRKAAPKKKGAARKSSPRRPVRRTARRSAKKGSRKRR